MNSLDIKQLLPELKKLVTFLAGDLLKRVNADAQISHGLREAFHQIEKGGRTAQAYEVWLEDYLDQVAVAWVLACVFVRFMEDNGLIDECWLAGEGERRRLAEDAQTLYFREHPQDSDREYFQHVFHAVGKIPAAADLFAEGRTPLWSVAPSGDAAMTLLKFWREMESETGTLKRPFQVADGDTRFLGDLYQELSEKAKKKYALLQTPVFVEEFILDRTLTPALAEFGLEHLRMIDPTCGSGHFLLGGFARLFREWCKRESNEIKAAQKALDGVWGVDINPFAVAIARFRLIVAAVQVCGIKRLKQAPGWVIHLATGDSLLFGSKPGVNGERVRIDQQLNLFDVPTIYAVEDRTTLHQILSQGYHVVVGNPPYIIVRDRVQNAAYRELYSACRGKYSFGVPFTQRFWELTIQTGESDGVSGYVGLITTNSFMKREFGKNLIEEFLPKIDLTHVIDTSGAYIPGHGTPTVILLGRNRKPSGDSIRAVQGIKGEPSTPDDPSQGKVWKSIIHQIDRAGSQDEFISTADVPRTTFNTHPWSIGGGGASDLQERLDKQQQTLGERVHPIGFASFPGLDDAFIMDAQSLRRKGADEIYIKQFVYGEAVRDWGIDCDQGALAPYSASFALIPLDEHSGWFRHLWQYRTSLENVVSFGGRTRKQNGDNWWGWYRWVPEKFRTALSVTFAFVSTHNHFVLDRGGKVFKQTAPIIKLLADATEDDHLSLLGLLNSSTACFWMHQVCHNKGRPGADAAAADERWEFRFEYDGTKLRSFPVPNGKPLGLARRLDTLSAEHILQLPDATLKATTPSNKRLSGARRQAGAVRGRMIAIQEELDWECYLHYGLLADALCYSGDDLPELALGQRAFEILMARQMAGGELETAWFERFGSIPITDMPAHWPSGYRDLVERRILAIETNKEIGLIETAEFKRRWQEEPWEEQEKRALKNWLLDRLESPEYRKGTKDNPELTTTAQMADVASADAEFLQVANLYRDRPDFDVAALVAELVEGEAVPFLPILRYKPLGLRKRELWERTWDLQRQQDAGKKVGEIPVPPKYATADFLKTDYWRLRGKLDVSKERWISYPYCSTDSDPTFVVGWAGWNHLEQATALFAYYDTRKREGWNPERLKPLLAGLDQLIPWLHQWHPEVDADDGETAGQSFQKMLESDAQELGLTLDDVRIWTPPIKQTKASKKKVKALP